MIWHIGCKNPCFNNNFDLPKRHVPITTGEDIPLYLVIRDNKTAGQPIIFTWNPHDQVIYALKFKLSSRCFQVRSISIWVTFKNSLTDHPLSSSFANHPLSQSYVAQWAKMWKELNFNQNFLLFSLTFLKQKCILVSFKLFWRKNWLLFC